MNFRKSLSYSFPTYKEFCSSYCRQNFSLTDSVIYYILKNQSLKVHQKLAQSCKHFFFKNPHVFTDDLEYNYNKKWIICLNNRSRLFNRSYCTSLQRKVQIKELTNIPAKIWLTNILNISVKQSNIASNLIPKIFKSDVKVITLEKQKLSLNEFIFLTPNVKFCSLEEVIIFSEDNGVEIYLETIIAKLSKLINFHGIFRRTSAPISSDTVKKLLELSHFKNVKYFRLLNLPQTFNIEIYYNFLKENKFKQVAILHYCGPLTDDYKNKLKEIVKDFGNGLSPFEFRSLKIYFQNELDEADHVLDGMVHKFQQLKHW